MTTEINKIVCPHCGEVIEDWHELLDYEELEQEFDMVCDNCKKEYHVKADMRPRITTS